MTYLSEVIRFTENIDDKVITECVDLLLKAKRIHLFGNGGSSAICSHVAVDLTKACGLEALTYHDPALLTCFSNDYGYEQAFSKMVDKYIKKNDAIIFISSSGESKNILNAVAAAEKMDAITLLFSGFDEKNSLNRVNASKRIHVNSANYNVIELLHLTYLLAICEKLRVLHQN
jgi:D-sedoheptulose 7-phosphate isomerase